MYKKILLPLDGSKVAECAIPHAETVAGACNVPDIVLLWVIPPLPLPGSYSISEGDRIKIESQHRAEAQSYLETMRHQVKGGSVTIDIVEGAAADTIVSYCEKNMIDLVVMATHGRSGLGRWTLGSVADKVVRRAPAPVLLVRAC